MFMIKRAGVVLVCALAFCNAKAQQTYEEMEQLTVNEKVTTVVTASEPIHFVDVSTDKVAGDKPISNTVRFKPKEGNHADGDILAIVTIITERYRTQYALVYTTRMEEAVTDKEILPSEWHAYTNPAVSMSTEDMTRFARRVWNSPAKIHNIKARSNHMLMRLNNVYAVGEYFFLDFSVENRTNIRFDIDELRVKLKDKKVQKAANNLDHRGDDPGEDHIVSRIPPRELPDAAVKVEEVEHHDAKNRIDRRKAEKMIQI